MLCGKNEYSRRAYSAARPRLGNFAYDLYPNYEKIISGFCHFLGCDKCIDSLTQTFLEFLIKIPTRERKNKYIRPLILRLPVDRDRNQLGFPTNF